MGLGRLLAAGHLNFGSVDMSLEFPEETVGDEKWWRLLLCSVQTWRH